MGRVLQIGGVKEKILAAKRSGIKNIIVPRENNKDFSEIPSYITEGLTVFFVQRIEEVIQIAFNSPYSFSSLNMEPIWVKKYPAFISTDIDTSTQTIKDLPSTTFPQVSTLPSSSSSSSVIL